LPPAAQARIDSEDADDFGRRAHAARDRRVRLRPGAPIAGEDEARRALEPALEAQLPGARSRREARGVLERFDPVRAQRERSQRRALEALEQRGQEAVGVRRGEVPQRGLRQLDAEEPAARRRGTGTQVGRMHAQRGPPLGQRQHAAADRRRERGRERAEPQVHAHDARVRDLLERAALVGRELLAEARHLVARDRDDRGIGEDLVVAPGDPAAQSRAAGLGLDRDDLAAGAHAQPRGERGRELRVAVREAREAQSAQPARDERQRQRGGELGGIAARAGEQRLRREDRGLGSDALAEPARRVALVRAEQRRGALGARAEAAQREPEQPEPRARGEQRRREPPARRVRRERVKGAGPQHGDGGTRQRPQAVGDPGRARDRDEVLRARQIEARAVVEPAVAEGPAARAAADLGLALEELDVVPRAREAKRAGEARESRADHSNRGHAAHGTGGPALQKPLPGCENRAKVGRVAPPIADPEDYVELRCRSAFSFLEAASNPEELAARAAELEYPALALGDRDGLYGSPRFHQAARAAGLRALVGAELAVGESEASARRVLLLVESSRGHRQLSRLCTLAHAGDRAGQAPRVSFAQLEEHAADLVALVRADAQLEPGPLAQLRGIFGAGTASGRGRLWVDVSRHLTRASEAASQRAVALAESCGVPLVASGDVRHARPEGRRLFDALVCLREKTSLDRAGRRLAENAERFLQPRAEMRRRFADRPDWIRASRAIAERCAFTLCELGYRFPEFPTGPGESQAQALRRLTAEGARGRYGHPLPARARAQLERELALIEKLELAGYFLIVHDIARFARESGMLAQGRGSAANSAVCYALGITAVDPVAMDLLFERFLSEERGEWPDIDIDLPSGEQRERVIQYVFDKYGERGAAMTAVAISYRTRLALREMGKVLDLPQDAIERISQRLSALEYRDDLDEVGATLREAGVDPEAPRIRALLALCREVQGLPRHLGQHPGGIVIAAGPLDEVVPIEPAAMPGRRVVQWDKDDCADLGLIKIDLLGLGMLAALEDTLGLVRSAEGVEIDLAKLPPDDPATYSMIRRADTVGTFQIESRAQMATLPRMRPRNFYDLVVEVALIRPGPVTGQMVHPYLNRRAGREPVRYPHPSLEPILARTLGVPIFQEQLLRIAMTAAGFSGGEAEELRRAMGFKRSVERMDRLERRLREGMDARGIRGAAQEEVLRGITSFALYGFPESHAASFALIAYASAYLKAHHPAAFLAGLLNAQPMGFYSPATLVKDAQRHGVAVLPIDVADSEWRCALRSPEAGRAPALRLGLRFVAGLREESGRALEAERRRAHFADLADLTRRVALSRRELDALAELGALARIDPAARTRRSALWQVAALERDPRSLFAGCAPDPGPSPLAELSACEETLVDYRASGLTTGPQVMAHLRAALRARGVLSAAELARVPDGRRVRTAGHAIVRQRPGSAKGFCFLTLEDETGFSNAILTPDVFRRFRAALHGSALLEIAGPLQNLDSVLHVRVRELRRLETGARVSTALPDSHDYR